MRMAAIYCATNVTGGNTTPLNKMPGGRKGERSPLMGQDARALYPLRQYLVGPDVVIQCQGIKLGKKKQIKDKVAPSSTTNGAGC